MLLLVIIVTAQEKQGFVFGMHAMYESWFVKYPKQGFLLQIKFGEIFLSAVKIGA